MNEIYTIQNEYLSLSICSLGAEIVSLTDRDGNERIWQADPEIWGQHAPLLFPLIARLKNETYTLNGKPYQIPIHGFANFSHFTVSALTERSLTLTLTDSEATRAQYPFSFRLDVTFTLEGSRLIKSHTVTNLSEEPMPYELGGHEGYRTTLTEGETMADSYVAFEDETALHPYLADENILFLDDHRTVALEDGKFFLTPDAFAQDALVLENLKRRRVTLGSTKNDHKITVTFGDFEYFGFWSWYKPYDTNYVCLEPWSSMPDFAHDGTELMEKRGVRVVQPGCAETLTYTVDVQ